MRRREAKNNQTTGATTANNTKIVTTRDTSGFTMKMVRLKTRKNQLFSEPNLQSTNPVSGSAIPQPTKVHQKDIDFSTAFLNTGNPKSAPPAGSLFLKFLHTDIRYLIYDNLVDAEHTVIISPTSKSHSPISALSQSCAEIRNEVKQWTQKRADLTPNPTFGFLNLPLTTFKLSWFDKELSPIRKYQRCYSPNAAKIFLPHLELWQRAMTIANSCEALYINHQIRYNKKLENFGPKKLTDPLLARIAYIAHNHRVLELNNHELTSGRPDKFDVEAKDFVVLDPKKFKRDIDASQAFSDLYYRTPYVWSKDWSRHEVEQEYCFVHPGDEQGKWARGLEACGSEAIRKGWPRWSCPYAFRFCLHLLTPVDESSAFDDDEEEDVQLRSGDGEMMEIDDEDYAMDLGSGIEEDNGPGMDREEDEDVEMDHQEIQTRKRTRSQLDMGYRAVKDGEGPLRKKTKQEGDVMDIEGEMAPFATPQQQQPAIQQQPTTQQQPAIQQQPNFVSVMEASAKRVINRSISSMDED
jgi:hypothetical protein